MFFIDANFVAIYKKTPVIANFSLSIVALLWLIYSFK